MFFRRKKNLLLLLLAFVMGCSPLSEDAQRSQSEDPYARAQTQYSDAQVEERGFEVAIFAGGCFWCMQEPFEQLQVKETLVGFSGGEEENPTYDDVTAGQTGHYEVIRIVYDPQEIGYEDLLTEYWRNIDPTQDDGQFADIGEIYRTVIFYTSQEQQEAAEKSKHDLTESGRFDEPIVTRILPAREFYAAENYHQMYFEKNPDHYYRYKRGSGRQGFLERHW